MDAAATAITEDDLYWFEYGDCHTLALEIHRRTGWQLAALGATVDEACGGHVFIITPTGRALDIQGAQPLEQFLVRWGNQDWTRHTPESIVQQFGHEPYEPGAPARASELAHHLIEGA